MTQFRPDPIDHMTGRNHGTLLPPGISAPGEGGKFAPDGTLLAWPGNTFIFHIDPTSDAHAALVAIQDGLKAGPHASAFAFLPASSLHMTVFQGISGPFANRFDWPEGVDSSTSRDEVTQVLIERTAGIELPGDLTVCALNVHAGHSMTMDGVGRSEQDLREIRARLRDATGIDPDGFDTYTFHVTLAYILRWLGEDEAREVQALSDALFAEHGDRLREIALGRPELCSFEDMFHFETLRYL